ncbi:hypothetical protein C5S31_04480 [ANME-1 cluster archaeon GoMg2]|nr:hypothetical protein [ANME-1 cluster archaeon GoMg2]
MNKKLAFVNLSLKRTLYQRNFYCEKMMVAGAGLLLFVGNAVADVGTHAKAAVEELDGGRVYKGK